MAKESKNILLVVGDDDYAAETEAKHAIEAHVPEDYRASAVEVVAGAASNAEGQLASIRACLASVQTPPFLDPVKLTWWKDVSFFPGGGRGGRISDEVKEALERFADTLTANPLPENQFLVITATALLSTSARSMSSPGIEKYSPVVSTDPDVLRSYSLRRSESITE